MNPHNGEILAHGQLSDLRSQQAAAARRGPAPRASNHAVSVPFEPGSVFKVITLSAALETTNLRAGDAHQLRQRRACSLSGRVIHEAHRGYGTIPMAKVLAKSSNIGAIQIGMRVGGQNCTNTCGASGSAQTTGIRLPAESSGMLRKLERWGTTSLGSIAMGHEVSVTTLQLAQACSVIANGGLLVKPQLILKEGDRPVTPVAAGAAHPEAGDRHHHAADDGRRGGAAAAPAEGAAGWLHVRRQDRHRRRFSTSRRITTRTATTPRSWVSRR